MKRHIPTFTLVIALFFALLTAPSCAATPNSLVLPEFNAGTSVDLGEVTFTFKVMPSKSMNVGAQLYVHRVGGDWDFVNATTVPGGGTPKVFSLYHNLPSEIQFTGDLQPGTYDMYRLLLFAAPDGQHVDYGQMVYDSSKDNSHRGVKVHFRVQTSESRIRAPQLVYAPMPDAEPNGNGTYTVTVPATVRFPLDYPRDGGGFWVMAKGSGGFSQVWMPFDNAQLGSDKLNPYMEAPVQFKLTGLKAGLWNVQFGIFKANWGDPVQWVYPGLDFEVGGDAWETKATRMPPRVRFVSGHFVRAEDAGAAAAQSVSLYSGDPAALRGVKFVRGGNYGNAIGWTLHPSLNSPGYFVLLGDIGCRFVRVLFNPDRYIDQPMYQHAVDQVVQNIWQANEYPLIAPQDLPKGSTLQERIERGQAVCRIMAENYQGKPVWLEVCNEPHEFSTWAQWKPVAERYVKTIRGVDPDMLIVVPFEGWSKDGRGAAASPITDVRVDLYDGHAYLNPQDVQARFGTAAKAGLPVLIGEYGSTNAGYIKEMNAALEKMSPPPVAIAPWAFTVQGQDQLPLVESSEGASIRFTPSGQAVAHAFNVWLSGKRLE